MALLDLVGVTLPSNITPSTELVKTGITEIATVVTAVFLIVFDAFVQAGVIGHPNSFLDMLAVGGFVALFGVAPQLSARTAVAAVGQQLNTKLDTAATKTDIAEAKAAIANGTP